MWKSIATGMVLVGLVLTRIALAGPIEDATAAREKGDHATANKIIVPLAEKGDAEAEFQLGRAYMLGHGVAKSPEEALKWYRRASEHGSAKAENNLGVMYVNGDLPKDIVESTKWFRRSAEKGFANAQVVLGDRHFNGEGAPQDDVEAMAWYHRAANQNHPRGQSKLAMMYFEGRGGKADAPEAARWFRKAAELGEPFAQYFLGRMYRDGIGVAVDLGEFAKWIQKSADQGNFFAQWTLGDMHRYGKGVPMNVTLAAELFRKAADQGHADAQKDLGELYLSGRGVPQDAKEATNWFELAAKNGNLPAKVHLEVMKKAGPPPSGPLRRLAEEALEREHLLAVQNYILKEDYPEKFGDKTYQVKTLGTEIVDIDGDGVVEVFLLTQPHYRQSPTITIYQVDRSRKVDRVVEGLAPGKLQPLSGDFLDAHTLGLGVDMHSDIGEQLKTEANLRKYHTDVRKVILKEKTRVVLYKQFFHMDMATAKKRSFVDMTHLPVAGKNACNEYEFSVPEEITSGTIEGQGTRKFLAAALDYGEIYVYRIDGVDKDGYLKKQLWILKPNPKPAELATGKGGELGYVTADEKFHKITLSGPGVYR